MAPWLFRLVVPAVLLLGAGCAASSGAPLAGSPPAQEEGTVRALRYRQLLVEGALDFSRGGGRWHDVLFLPEAGVVCNVVWESETVWGKDGSVDFREIPRMHAFHGELQESLEARPQDEEQGRRAPEEIRIPAALAREIVALAERTRREREASERLGGEAVEAGVVGGKETVRARDPFR